MSAQMLPINPVTNLVLAPFSPETMKVAEEMAGNDRAQVRISEWLSTLTPEDQDTLNQLLAGKLGKQMDTTSSSRLQRKLSGWKSALNVQTLPQLVAVWGRVRTTFVVADDTTVPGMPTVIRYGGEPESGVVSNRLRARLGLSRIGQASVVETSRKPDSASDTALLSPAVWMAMLRIAKRKNDKASLTSVGLSPEQCSTVVFQHKAFLSLLSKTAPWTEEDARRFQSEAEGWHIESPALYLPFTLTFGWLKKREPVGFESEYLTDHGWAARADWHDRLKNDPDSLYPELSDIELWCTTAGNLQHRIGPTSLEDTIRDRDLCFGPLTGLISAVFALAVEESKVTKDHFSTYLHIARSRREFMSRRGMDPQLALGAMSMYGQGVEPPRSWLGEGGFQ